LEKLIIGDLIVEKNIIQGGMGVGISLANLSSAVANQGGVGVISTVGIGLVGNPGYDDYQTANSNALIREIRKARSLTKGIIGVNIMVALTDYARLVATSISEGIDIIFSGAGLPLDLPSFLTNSSKTKLIPIISSARAAKVLIEKWLSKYNYCPDAFVLEGPKAGGHLGFKKENLYLPEYQLENLLPEVLEAVQQYEKKLNRKIPVIVGGGIFTGADIYEMIKKGAAGVQMGTRFVTTYECDASINFKQAYINSTEDDIHIIDSPVGMPGRVIWNDFIKNVYETEQKQHKCLHRCLKTCKMRDSRYCIAEALIQAQMGKMLNGFAFSGTNAYRCHEIVSVKELFAELEHEYDAVKYAESLKTV